MLQTQKSKIAALCAFQAGYTARSRLEPQEVGGVRAVQLRDLGENGLFDPSNTLSYAIDGPVERYEVSGGDVLFRARGDRNTAVAVLPDTTERAVAILPLIILRPDRTRVDPEYLAWFINQSSAQRHFDECAQGQNLRMIPKPCLEELEVPLPPLDVQRQIVTLARLSKHEHALTMRLAEKRAQLTSQILLQHALKADAQLDSKKSNATMKGINS